MTLEEAIRHAEEKAEEHSRCGEDHAQLAEWLKELKMLQSAQPKIEERKEESAQNVLKDDLISRKAAIDAIDKEYRCTDHSDDWDGLKTAMLIIENLPSAQPEIIYCKKCEHWTRTYGDEQWGLGDCDVFDKHLVMCNGYCAWAERRTDG